MISLIGVETKNHNKLYFSNNKNENRFTDKENKLANTRGERERGTGNIVVGD